ncbi:MULTISPECIES: hypothetical protein [unclassified Devosia]|uniref:hypothetical protein n=1 Tax=unclassified Devosia TaxID=196773 RepID=UPI00145CAECB|nr:MULTISPECIES: hypothetical protein [unclassified Devosia]MBJ6987029.1 hypothetical protein [Devosia sp. MC521]MBJ7576597.1 hypothetical protein [Devosia sp. MC532]MBK1795800.1 hypothetical protein [Devosia sp. WQ 349K1]QMW64048.1 hypothetical protein H4N61_06990 [Devosia sp. MC521]
MALFAVSFKLEDGGDYQERYNALIKSIETNADGDIWGETSSFFLVPSTRNSLGLKEDIMAGANMQDGDVVVVINLSKTKGHSTDGIKKKSLFKKLIDQR